MKILFLNEPTEKIGGGQTWFKNFSKGLQALGHEFTHDISAEWDVALVPGATMVKRSRWERAREKGKVVLRIDGVPEDWRNRGTGWSRLRDYAKQADLVIYQSAFSRGTTGRLVNREEGKVIYNGVDKDIFNTDGEKLPTFGNPSILYCNYRKGENNKRVEEAIERFRQFKLDNPAATMTFAGNFSKEQFKWDGVNWDFSLLDLEKNKDWQYLGIISDRKQLAKIMRSCDAVAWVSFADPCPNTFLECLHCGLEPIWTCDYGSTRELVDLFNNGYDFGLEHMTEQYVEAFKEVINNG